MSGEFISQAVMGAADRSPSLLKSHPLNSSQQAIVSHGFPCCLKGLVPLGDTQQKTLFFGCSGAESVGREMKETLDNGVMDQDSECVSWIPCSTGARAAAF